MATVVLLGTLVAVLLVIVARVVVRRGYRSMGPLSTSGYGQDAIQIGYTGNENDPPGHLPYVRHVHEGWTHDKYGRWESSDTDPSQWEVVCTACGDDEGPADSQPEAARRLRGPYPTEHRAHEVAKAHERENASPPRWTPGSTFPQKF